MTKSDLISGTFVDRAAGDLAGDLAEVSDADIAHYLQGHYGMLTSRQILYLKGLGEDPLGKKWEAAHADCIFVDPETFLGFLFVYFPAGDSFEKNYQDLRAMVGEKPIDFVDLQIVATKLTQKGAVSSKSPYRAATATPHFN